MLIQVTNRLSNAKMLINTSSVFLVVETAEGSNVFFDRRSLGDLWGEGFKPLKIHENLNKLLAQIPA